MLVWLCGVSSKMLDIGHILPAEAILATIPMNAKRHTPFVKILVQPWPQWDTAILSLF